MDATVWEMLAIVLPALALASNSCPSQPWNDRCHHCCEEGWLACRCTATGEMTGYPVPCCREGDLCTPCVDYSGCSVFETCKQCYTIPRIGPYPVNDLPTFCSECYKGWRGSDCRTCGSVLNDNVGFIEIEKYPNEANCLWTIDVGRNSTVELKFEALDIEFEARCLYDSLTIYDGRYIPADKVYTFCGNASIEKYTSKTHVLVLHFKSDETISRSGFRVSYTKLNVCARRPCLNGGACMLTFLMHFICICPVGYHGTLCELAVRCKLPFLTPYLTISLERSGNEYGAKVEYECEQEFFPRGPSKAYCKANGRWTENPPTCVPTCPKPKKLKHGNIDGGIYTVNSKIVYVCKQGYHLIGNRSQACGKNRKWSGEVPVCVPNKVCVDPGHPENGRRRLIDPVRTYGSGDRVLANVLWPHTQVLYDCNSSYKLTGRKVRTCLLTGKLTGDQPICVKDSASRCLPFDLDWVKVHHTSLTLTYQSHDWRIASTTNGTFATGTTVEVTCLAPLLFHGSMTTLECSDNGTWILQTGSTFPKCVNATSCVKLSLPTHMRIVYDLQIDDYRRRTLGLETQEALDKGFLPTGTLASYSCRNGTLNGISTRVCMDNGTWTDSQPECIFGCEDPGVPSHSLRKAWIGPESSEERRIRTAEILRSMPAGSRLPRGTVLAFFCETNLFFQKGIQKRVCLSNGQWSTSNNPTCLPKCGAFPKTTSYLQINSTTIFPLVSPWHAVIKRSFGISNKWKVQCGGAYVGHNLVLTSAQCVTYASTVLALQPSEIHVGLGQNWRGLPTQHHKVSEIAVHRNYDPIGVDYDIAVIVLSTAVRLDTMINLWPICIAGFPDHNTPRSRSLSIEENAIVSSWTVTNDTTATSEARPLNESTTLSSDEWTHRGEIPNESNLFLTAAGTPNSNENYSSPNSENKTIAAVGVSLNASRQVYSHSQVQHVQVTRKRVPFCAKAFRKSLAPTRMICALMPGADNCFESRGNPLVVNRPLKTQRYNKKDFKSMKNFGIIQMTPASNATTAGKLQESSAIWVLAGLASWTERGGCVKPDGDRHVVFVKVRDFAKWIAVIKTELDQKKLLLPPN